MGNTAGGFAQPHHPAAPLAWAGLGSSQKQAGRLHHSLLVRRLALDRLRDGGRLSVAASRLTRGTVLLDERADEEFGSFAVENHAAALLAAEDALDAAIELQAGGQGRSGERYRRP